MRLLFLCLHIYTHSGPLWVEVLLFWSFFRQSCRLPLAHFWQSCRLGYSIWLSRAYAVAICEEVCCKKPPFAVPNLPFASGGTKRRATAPAQALPRLAIVGRSPFTSVMWAFIRRMSRFQSDTHDRWRFKCMAEEDGCGRRLRIPTPDPRQTHAPHRPDPRITPACRSEAVAVGCRSSGNISQHQFEKVLALWLSTPHTVSVGWGCRYPSGKPPN